MTVPANKLYDNTIGSALSGDELNTFAQTFSNFAALRGFVGKPGMIAMVLGNVSTNDGGQGLFTFVVGAASDDNQNTLVVLTWPPAFWQRIGVPFGSGALSPTSYGAVADGKSHPLSQFFSNYAAALAYYSQFGPSFVLSGATINSQIDGVAINAMFDVMRASGSGGVATIPPGTYEADVSINATGLHVNASIYAAGATINSTAAGRAAFDMLGSASTEVHRLRVLGDIGNTGAAPKCGFQLGRPSVGFQAVGMNLIFCSTAGNFTATGLYSQSAEVANFYACAFDNDYPSPGPFAGYAVVMDAFNTSGFGGVSSLYVTVTLPLDTANSFENNKFHGGDMRSTGVPFWFSGTKGMQLDNVYLNTKGGISGSTYSIVSYHAHTVDNAFSKFKVHCEGNPGSNKLTDAVLFSGPATSMVLQCWEFEDPNCQATNSVFKIDPTSSITAAAMRNSKLWLGQQGGFYNSIFNIADTQAWNIASDVFVYNMSGLAWFSGAALFTGNISGNTLTVTGGPTFGAIAIGQSVNGASTGTVITGGSGTSWTVNNSQTAPTVTGSTFMWNIPPSRFDGKLTFEAVVNQSVNSLFFGQNISQPQWSGLGAGGCGITGISSTYTDTTVTGTIVKEAMFAKPQVTYKTTNTATVQRVVGDLFHSPLANCSVNGTIVANVLTITSSINGLVAVGDLVSGAGVVGSPTVLSSAGAGAWNLSASATNVASPEVLTIGNVTAGALLCVEFEAPTGHINQTFAQLAASCPAPSGVIRGFISDCLVTAAGNFGGAVTVGGGAHTVPLFWDDGSATWRIG